jgi:hypothetical protein
MSDHDFEKRVKQKMDELKFTPSDAVWQAVQLEIRKDRPRRRGWILVPILLASLGVAGYFIFNSNKSGSEISYQKTEATGSIEGTKSTEGTQQTEGTKSTKGTQQAEATQSTEVTQQTEATQKTKSAELTPDGSRPVPGATSSTAKEADNSENNDAADPARVPGTSGNSSARDKADPTGPLQETVNSGAPERTVSMSSLKPGKNPKRNKSGNPALRQTIDPLAGASGSLAVVKRTGANNKITGNAGSVPKSTSDLSAGQTNPPVDRPIPDRSKTGTDQQSSYLNQHDSLGEAALVVDHQKINNVDSGLVAESVLKKELQTDSSNTQTSKLVKSRKKKTGWDWGLTISGGISNISDGPLTGVLKSSHMADAASSAQAAGNPNFLFAPSTTGLPPVKSSEVKAGPYFSIGGFVTKQLSRTFSFSAGLQYSRYNTIIEVGYRVDSSRLVNNGSQVMNVARYYRADDNSKFSNKYHFIELPLALSTRLTGSKSIPVFWNAGIHLSQMIGSNALVFDSGTGVYYKDKSTLNKTQLGIATGFTFGLFGKSKIPMLLGPSVKYNASEMFNKDILNGNHLISAGLDLRILLNKK